MKRTNVIKLAGENTVPNEDSNDVESHHHPCGAEFSHSPLWKAFTPLLHSMALFGLYLPPETPGAECKKYMKHASLMKANCIVALCLLNINLGRFFFVFDSSDIYGPTLFAKILTLLWFIITLVFLANCYHIFSTKDAIRSLFSQLYRIAKEESVNIEIIKKLAIGLTVASWFIVVGNLFFLGYLMFFSAPGTFDMMTAPHPNYVTLSEGLLVAYKMIILICAWYNTGAWIFPSMFLFLITHILANSFTNFRETVEREVQNDKALNGKITALRRRHQAICDATETTDDHFKILAASILGIGLLQVILIMFNLLTEKNLPTEMLLSYFTWLFTSVLFTLMLTINCGRINHEAHDVKKSLYKADVGNDCPEAQQLLVFLSRVEGSGIGITAMDMLVIDRPAFLTICAGFISYFTLLLTFESSGSSCTATSSPINCTELLQSLLNASTPVSG